MQLVGGHMISPEESAGADYGWTPSPEAQAQEDGVGLGRPGRPLWALLLVVPPSPCKRPHRQDDRLAPTCRGPPWRTPRSCERTRATETPLGTQPPAPAICPPLQSRRSGQSVPGTCPPH